MFLMSSFVNSSATSGRFWSLCACWSSMSCLCCCNSSIDVGSGVGCSSDSSLSSRSPSGISNSSSSSSTSATSASARVSLSLKRSNLLKSERIDGPILFVISWRCSSRFSKVSSSSSSVNGFCVAGLSNIRNSLNAPDSIHSRSV